MSLTTLVWKNLARRPLRSLLTVLGVAIALTAVVALRGASLGFEQSFLEMYSERGADLVVQRSGGAMQLSSGVNERFGDEIRALSGVKQVVGGLMDMVSLPEHNLTAVIVNGWTVDSPVLARVKILSGRRLAAGDEQQVMLGKTLAANLKLGAGDKVQIYGRSFQVVGVFESFSSLENGAAFLLQHRMQQLMDRPRQVTGFVVQALDTGNPVAVEQLRQRIEALDPKLTATPTPEFVHGIVQIRSGRVAAWVTSIIALIVGVVGILNAMLMSVFERTRDIGTLRALGWRKGRVVRMILAESLAVSVVGGLLGVAGGAGLLRLFSYLPPTAGFVAGRLEPWLILEALAMAVGVGLIGAAYPAYWAASLQPVEALRSK